MTVTKSDFDPTVLGQYEDPPELLHFQWEGEDCGHTVYRYALVDMIDSNEIDARTKRKNDEVGMNNEDMWERAINKLKD